LQLCEFFLKCMGGPTTPACEGDIFRIPEASYT